MLPLLLTEPIDEIDASLYSFGAPKVRELGEEDPSIKGAGVVVALLKRVQPFKNAVAAQVVSAGQPLGDFQLAILFPIVQAVEWVRADVTVALILGQFLDVDAWAGDDEGQGR